MAAGRILRTGGKELALELERRGYDWIDEGLESSDQVDSIAPALEVV
jgi:Fe-S cluster assembly ATP-binding protein